MNLITAIAMCAGWTSGTVSASVAETTKEVKALRTELADLKRELASLKGPEDLAGDLKIHPSRLPAARRAARALGITMVDIPAFAAEHNCSAARVIATYSAKTRRQVLDEDATLDNSPWMQSIKRLMTAGRSEEAIQLALKGPS